MSSAVFVGLPAVVYAKNITADICRLFYKRSHLFKAMVKPQAVHIVIKHYRRLSAGIFNKAVRTLKCVKVRYRTLKTALGNAEKCPLRRILLTRL